MSYKQLYVVPVKSFEDYLKTKMENFPNLKNLKVDQLNINEGEKINSNFQSKIKDKNKDEKESNNEYMFSPDGKDNLYAGQPKLDLNHKLEKDQAEELENQAIKEEFFPNKFPKKEVEELPDNNYDSYFDLDSKTQMEKVARWAKQQPEDWLGSSTSLDETETPIKSTPIKESIKSTPAKSIVQAAKNLAKHVKINPKKTPIKEEPLGTIPKKLTPAQALSQVGRNFANLQNRQNLTLEALRPNTGTSPEIKRKIAQLNRAREEDDAKGATYKKKR